MTCNDGTLSVAFSYDPIGNRTSSATYGEAGEAQVSTYVANALNQYVSRTTPGFAAVRGEADPAAAVTVNGRPAYRLGAYFFGGDVFDNSASGGFARLETYAALAQADAGGNDAADLVSSVTGQVYVAQSPEAFAYDADGNQTRVTTRTGRWRVEYNGENRPILWTREGDGKTVAMTYDHMGRRRTKDGQRFFYDGYLQVADNNGNAYAWDCTEPVATRPLAWSCGDLFEYYTHDGNKNVSEVIAADGAVSAHYEYAPFGAVIAHCGESSAANPWRFSSEYADDELGCDYYNYREYEPVTGRWMSEDGAEDNSVLSLYGFCSNRTGEYDFLGLWLGYRHKKLTKRAFKHVESLFAHPFGENISLKFDLEKIMDVIVDANVNTDSEDATADDQGYHYCTLVNENYNKSSHEKYRNQYTQYLRENEKNYQDFLEPEKLDCKQALKVLGLLSHMWQDYYAHGVERDDSWFGAVIGKIKGSPDDPQMIPVGFGFKGFRGGHGGAFRLLNLFTRVEPGDRADDSDIRRRQAKWFTIEKFHKFLPVWVDACKCEKEWLAK